MKHLKSFNEMHNPLCYGEVHQDGHSWCYWSPEEKKFFGDLPKLDLVRIPVTSKELSLDRRTYVHCAFNCPHGLKPLLAYDKENIYCAEDGNWVNIDDKIKNIREWRIISDHVWNVFHDISNRPGPGWQHNVRQRCTYILDMDYKPSKMVMYTVKSEVNKILRKHGLVE
jgi:hypothetical protein